MTIEIFEIQPWHSERDLLHLIARQNNHIIGMGNRIMAQVSVEQNDLDALAASLSDLATTLNSDETGIAAEIQALNDKINAGTPLTPGDLSGLQAAQASLSAAVTAAANLLPAATPAPAPTTTTPTPLPADGSTSVQ